MVEVFIGTVQLPTAIRNITIRTYQIKASGVGSEFAVHLAFPVQD
jgi:hypothetical protein